MNNKKEEEKLMSITELYGGLRNPAILLRRKQNIDH